MPTLAGFLYLAIVLDAWSRKIIGWSMANHLRTAAGAGRDGGGNQPASTKGRHPSQRPQASRARRLSRLSRDHVVAANTGRSSSGRPRRDWPDLDRQLVERFDRKARGILTIEPPVRVTLAELERRLGVRGWLGKRRAKLPLSNATLACLTESVEAYRQRRVRHVIASRHLAHALKPWRVMRLAGLVGSDLPMIHEEIELLEVVVDIRNEIKA